jgi:hypothetical protein
MTIRLTPKERLEPPVGYTGGKRRFAAPIADRLLAHKPERIFDLGCGSGAVTMELLNRGFPLENLVMVDAGPWGWFWKAVADGTLDIMRVRSFFDVILKMDPRHVANFVESDVATLPPTAETFLVLQAAAFGSTPVWWDGNRWRRGEGNRGFQARGFWEPGPKSKETKPRGTIFTPEKILRRTEEAARRMRGIKAVHGKAEDLALMPPGVVYIDPPYANFSGYGEIMDLNRVLQGAKIPVYISEGVRLVGSVEAWLLDGGRKGAALNGKSRKDTSAAEEWLNFFPGNAACDG